MNILKSLISLRSTEAKWFFIHFLPGLHSDEETAHVVFVTLFVLGLYRHFIREHIGQVSISVGSIWIDEALPDQLALEIVEEHHVSLREFLIAEEILF